MVGVLFVCLGNICRSPAAEGAFTALAEEAGLSPQLRIDSAGTGGWHVGEPPDSRMRTAARARGLAIDHFRARQVRRSDFTDFDYVLAMDEENLAALMRLAPAAATARTQLFLDYAPASRCREVPDPYYGDADGFEQVLDLAEEAARGLLMEIRARHRL